MSRHQSTTVAAAAPCAGRAHCCQAQLGGVPQSRSGGVCLPGCAQSRKRETLCIPLALHELAGWLRSNDSDSVSGRRSLAPRVPRAQQTAAGGGFSLNRAPPCGPAGKVESPGPTRGARFEGGQINLATRQLAPHRLRAAPRPPLAARTDGGRTCACESSGGNTARGAIYPVEVDVGGGGRGTPCDRRIQTVHLVGTTCQHTRCRRRL